MSAARDFLPGDGGTCPDKLPEPGCRIGQRGLIAVGETGAPQNRFLQRPDSDSLVESADDVVEQQRNAKLTAHHRQDGVVVIDSVGDLRTQTFVMEGGQDGAVAAFIKQNERFLFQIAEL